MKKYERIIFLHRTLAEGAEFRVSVMATKLGVAVRTVQRDLDQLRNLGLPLVRNRCLYSLSNKSGGANNGANGFVSKNRLSSGHIQLPPGEE